MSGGPGASRDPLLQEKSEGNFDLTELANREERGLKGRSRPVESASIVGLWICGAISIATTIGILYELGKESLLFFSE